MNVKGRPIIETDKKCMNQSKNLVNKRDSNFLNARILSDLKIFIDTFHIVT